jgi:hypothetical protein
MKVKRHNNTSKQVASWLSVLFTFFCLCEGISYAQALSSSQEGSVVPVISWKKGDNKIVEHTLDISLQNQEVQYEFDVFGAADKSKHFRLRLRHSTEKTLINSGLPCWIADFREITKDSISGANLVGPDLLSVEGPGVGDNFPREEWAGCLCPIEKPNKVLDGPFYPIRTERRFFIEGFVLSLRVTDYQLDKKRNELRKLDLRIAFWNQ